MHGPSVVQKWVSSLTLKQQAVLMTAIRGCDGVPKEDPSKVLVRHYRWCVLNPADNPSSEYFGKFMCVESPTYEEVKAVVDHPDHYPLHWFTHFIQAAEILGYKHPNAVCSQFWLGVYHRAVTHGLHLRPEKLEALNQRLSPGSNG